MQCRHCGIAWQSSEFQLTWGSATDSLFQSIFFGRRLQHPGLHLGRLCSLSQKESGEECAWQNCMQQFQWRIVPLITAKIHIWSSCALTAAHVDGVTLVQVVHMTASCSVSSHMEGLQSWPSVPQLLETPYLAMLFGVQSAKGERGRLAAAAHCTQV